MKIGCNFINEFMIKGKIQLKNFNPNGSLHYKNKDEAAAHIEENIIILNELQYQLYAENKRSVLVILQGMDTAGKDGTIRHVMSGLNPQSCRVASFKAPTHQELSHDFLWRIHQETPASGQVVIFNRSHYEDVLVVRIHKLVEKEVWQKRFEQINNFEKLLHDNNVIIMKFFLHISKDEQHKRLKERLNDPAKQWKISPDDFNERKLWDKYIKAYQDAINKCSDPHAPWFVIPSNKKWFRNLAVSSIMVNILSELKMKIPKASFDLSKFKNF